MEITANSVSLSRSMPALPAGQTPAGERQTRVVATESAPPVPVKKPVERAESRAASDLGPGERAVAQINKLLKNQQQALEFSLDKGSNRVVYKLVDTNTGEVIRQIPSEEFLSLSRSLAAKSEGALLSEQA